MRTAGKNKQKMYYALSSGNRVEIPERDENGNPKTIVVDGDTVVVGSGAYTTAYEYPVTFYGNISMSGGEAVMSEFGVDIASYDAVLVVEKDALPITETSLIWFQSEPTFLDRIRTIVDPKSADYRVLAIKPSLNGLKAVLGRVTK